MRTCPKCGSIYVSEAGHCGIDGEKLVERQDDPLIGTTVDRYHIQERLGTGAMGCVYRAQHTVIDRVYAVKILFGDLASDGRLIARFRREAQAVAKMEHPNIVSVVDFGTAPSGLSFLVMELVDGKALDKIIAAHSPLRPDLVAKIARGIAAGLSEAHARGFVHRDLKPANIMLGRNDQGEVVKILDFGVVGVIDEEQATKLTRTGGVIGTPLYMSPEQAQGEAATKASDLYSLGCIIYEMLVGVPPFRAATFQKVMMKHLTEAPPLPPPSFGLEALVPSLLHKSPERRIGRAELVVAELDRILAQSGLAEFRAPEIDLHAVDGLMAFAPAPETLHPGRITVEIPTEPPLARPPAGTDRNSQSPTDPPRLTQERLPRPELVPFEIPEPRAKGGFVPPTGSPAPPAPVSVGWPAPATPLALPPQRAASDILPSRGNTPVLGVTPPQSAMSEPLAGIPTGQTPTDFRSTPSDPKLALRTISQPRGAQRSASRAGGRLDVLEGQESDDLLRRPRWGPMVSVLLIALGLVAVFLLREQRTAEQAAQAAHGTQGNGPEEKTKSKPGEVDPQSLVLLENHLARQLAARGLTLVDLDRLESTQQLSRRWQQMRKAGSPAEQRDAMIEIIRAVDVIRLRDPP